MNYDDVIALVRAGYTKTEIDAMAAGDATPPATPEQPKEAPAVPPLAIPETSDSTETLLRQLFGSVNRLTQAVQAQNLATITGQTQAQTTEEIARNATARMMGATEKE